MLIVDCNLLSSAKALLLAAAGRAGQPQVLLHNHCLVSKRAQTDPPVFPHIRMCISAWLQEKHCKTATLNKNTPTQRSLQFYS